MPALSVPPSPHEHEPPPESLLDIYLPTYHFRERHTLTIHAPAAQVMQAAREYRADSDPLFRCAIAVREWPLRLRERLSPHTYARQPPFSMDNFTLLDHDAHQLAYGLAGKFWQVNYGQVRVADGPAFLALQTPGTAKLVVSFVAHALGEGHTQLTTETRVFCQDSEARRRFAPYWYVIRPVSGLIRRRILSAIGRRAST